MNRSDVDRRGQRRHPLHSGGFRARAVDDEPPRRIGRPLAAPTAVRLFPQQPHQQVSRATHSNDIVALYIITVSSSSSSSSSSSPRFCFVLVWFYVSSTRQFAAAGAGHAANDARRRQRIVAHGQRAELRSSSRLNFGARGAEGSKEASATEIETVPNKTKDPKKSNQIKKN